MIIAELEQWSPYLWLVLYGCTSALTFLVGYLLGFEQGVKEEKCYSRRM